MLTRAVLKLTASFVLGFCVACALALLATPVLAAKRPLPGASTTRDKQGRIIAQVFVDGKGPFRFLVDTGANSSMVTPTLLQKLSLAPGESASSEQVQGITGSEQLPWAPIKSLRIGDIIKEDLRLPVGDSPVLDGIDGILGLAGLGAVRVVVDFHDSRVIIDRSSPGGLPGYLDIAAQRTPGGLLLIPARVGNVRVAAVIDTGATVTLGNSALHQALLREAAKQEANTQIFGVTRQTSKGDITLSPEVFLGPAVIEHLGIVYSDIPIFKIWHLDSQPALILGMNVLSTVEVLALDYPHARVYMLPVESGQHAISITTMHVESPLLNHGDGG